MTTRPVGGVHPTALISWAHRDPSWDDMAAERRRDHVLRLALKLRESGIDCDVDAYHPNEDWTRWGPIRVTSVDVVLIVVSESWRHAWEGTGDPAQHIGAAAEASALKSLEVRVGRTALQQRCRLLLLPGSDDADVPTGMHGIQRYRLGGFTPNNLEPLLRDLTGQPDILVPPLGPLPVLPPSVGSPSEMASDDSGEAEQLRNQLAALPTPEPQDSQQLPWVRARHRIEGRLAELATPDRVDHTQRPVEPIRWFALPEAASVTWRAEWSRGSSVSDGAAVVLHVVPYPARLLSRRLRSELQVQLAAGMRSLDLGTSNSGLQTNERDDASWFTQPAQHGRYGEVRRGEFTGCRIDSNGQISVWFTLARDSMGSVLDEHEVTRHLALGLELAASLLAHPDLESSTQCAVAVELDDTILLTDGAIAGLGRRSPASMRGATRGGVRIPAEEAVMVDDLRRAEAIAAPLSRMLVEEWRR